MSNERTFRDALLEQSAALPNAANTVNSNSLDLGSVTPFPVMEKIQVKLSTTVGTGANNKNINLVLQHSAEPNANFTNIAELAKPILTVVDDNGGGYPAGEALVYLPPGAKRYIRASATGEANGGDASDGTFTFELLL